jgi:large subunit ribosomal protein L32
MPVPKKKTSKARPDPRRSHDAISAPNVTVCPNCQEPRLAHHVCPNCGHYNSREVIAVEEK